MKWPPALIFFVVFLGQDVLKKNDFDHSISSHRRPTNADAQKKKKMAILCGYFKGETYGLLGPQMAATVIEQHTPYDCIVIAVAKEDDKQDLKKALANYFGPDRPIVGFSTLSGRQDLFELSRELKHNEAITILAGPLIIHHASALGDWIRKAEQAQNRRFTRLGSIIEWW